MKLYRLILGLSSCLLCFANAGASTGLSDSQRAWVKKAERHEKEGWIYLHIEGGAQERGFQYGYLLAKEIGQSIRVRQSVWEYTSGMDWTWLVEKSKTMYTPKVDAESLAELGGMSDGLAAAGAGHSVDELIAYNGWFELAWYWWPAEKKKINSNSPNPPKQSCSSFIATGRMTADGGIVLGHNSMVGYPEADFNLVLDLVPENGHRILMQTLPGWIHSGTDFFVTSAGLVGSETTIGGFDGFDEKGLPEFVRMRRATQDASGIDEWCNVMKKGNNGGYANAWLLGDVNSGEIARLELGLKHVGFEKKKDGFFTGSNIAENLKVLRFETDVNETDIRLSSIGRRVRWKKLMSEYEGKIDIDRAKGFESDHYDSHLGKENPGGRSLCGHFELDPQAWGPWPGAPFSPAGTFDGKVVDSKMARQMSFTARWGSACGMAFDATKFLGEHPQFDWMQDILKSRPAQNWTVFRAGEKE